MRTLAITQNITLDGSIEMLGDWFDAQGQGDDGNADMLEQLHRESEQSDAILLGRRTFEDMRGYWPLQTDDTTGVTAHLNQVAKYVVSSTITDPAWDGTTVIDGEVMDRVRALKQEPGKDIVVTGSIQLCHDLIRTGLVDEYRLFTYPLVQGRGRRLFSDGYELSALELLASTAFRGGLTYARYAPRSQQ